VAKFAWEGRIGSGKTARGVISAASQEAALAKIEASGVKVTQLRQSGGSSEPEPAGSEEAVAPVVDSRPGASLRDKFFYLAVVFVFTSIGLGAAYVAPVLSYDCTRADSGSVDCSVERRIYGALPLPTIDATRVLSADLESSTDARHIGQRVPLNSTRLVLTCPSGPCWTSVWSSWPLGRTNSELSQEIGDLVSGGGSEFHGWQAERIPLLVGVTFQLPLAIVLLSLVVRLTLGEAWALRKATEFEQWARERKHRRG
jgi:hypothetical protein